MENVNDRANIQDTQERASTLREGMDNGDKHTENIQDKTSDSTLDLVSWPLGL